MCERLYIWLCKIWHVLFHCKCCKYCDVCKACRCEIQHCGHTDALLSNDRDDVESGFRSRGTVGESSARRCDSTEISILRSTLQQRDQKIKEVEDAIAERDAHITKLQKKLDEVTLRLSAEMSSKLSSNESAVENVSIKNRPMNVSEEYQLMCSNEWLAAKEAVDGCVAKDQEVPESSRVTVLREIIRVTDFRVKERFAAVQSQVEALLQALCDPLSSSTHTKLTSGTSTQPRKLNTLNVTNVIGDFLRLNADTVNYDDMVQVVFDSVGPYLTQLPHNSPLVDCISLWNLCKNSDHLKTYIHKTATVAWKMAVQRPPMGFQFTQDNRVNPQYHELHWLSQNVPNAVVFEVYPILLHHTSVMAKGKVLLVDPKSHKA